MQGFDVLALDLAKRTGVARGLAGQTPILTCERFARADDDDCDAFGRFTLWLARLLRDNPPALIAVERPIPVYDSTFLYGLRGIALGLARAKRVRIEQVPIQTWRKYFLGTNKFENGSEQAKAEAVKQCAKLGWSVPLSPRGDPIHDFAEAAGIWTYVCSQRWPQLAHRIEPLFTFTEEA